MRALGLQFGQVLRLKIDQSRSGGAGDQSVLIIMSKTVCYWRGSAEIRDDIISAMVERNYSVKQVRSLDEVLSLTKVRNSCVLIVDGTASQREASDRIVEMTNTPVLFDVPIVFIASQAAKRSTVLKTNYKQLHPVDVPYNLALVVRALDILVDSEKAAGALLAASMVVPPGLKGAIEEEAEARDEAQTSEPSVTEASVESVAVEQSVAAPFATSVESDPTVADPSRMEQKAELASSQAPSEDANTAS